MKVALEYAEKVDRLIVSDIGPQDYPSHHDTILEALSAVDLDSLDSRSRVQESMNQYVEQQGVVQFLAKNLYWKEKGRLAWRMNLPVIRENMDEILAGIGDSSHSGMTLFIRGGKSDYIQDDDMMSLHMQFNRSVVKTIEEAGHWLHAERPEEFYVIVNEFLRDSAM
jgi:pimeloyl-ACP methyl ester carboxylesterase